MRWAALFGVLLALWLLWSGLYKPLIIGLGVASCLVCVWITMRMRAAGEPVTGRISLTRALGYQFWLLKEIARANGQVIRIVLSPRLPIRPVVVTLTAPQRTELGRVVYGNSITLTPGTLTMDLDADGLKVHALTPAGADALLRGEMAARVSRLEGPA